MDNDWIRLDKVSMVRNRKTILEAIQWSVSPGDHWVVMGANGSGKTTFLQLLAGYLWPTRGNITVLGERFGHTISKKLCGSSPTPCSSKMEKSWRREPRKIFFDLPCCRKLSDWRWRWLRKKAATGRIFRQTP